MACEPPFCLGTGGWCGCNCGCCPPCNVITEITYKEFCGNAALGEEYTPPCYVEYVPYCIPDVVAECLYVDYEGCDCGTATWDCNTSGDWTIVTNNCSESCVPVKPSGSCDTPVTTNCKCQATASNDYDIKITFDGCGLYPRYPCTDTISVKCFTFTAVGNGTITVDPDITIYCENGQESTIGYRVNGVTSLSVNDCDEVTVTRVWEGSICCPCCPDNPTKTVLSNYCGGTTYDFCDTSISMRAKILKRQLKSKILSRIKKVHYKP